YPETSPTPMLSFAVRHYKASAGIMVTASHNPSMYNGYKAYNDEGCQLTSEAADEVLECIHRLDPFKDVRRSGAGAPITMIDQTVVDEYVEAVLGAGVPTDCKDLEVVFSPLNGSGLKPVLRILEEIGVGKVHVVESQREPDGNFPTCSYPNPEKKEALAEGLALCRRLETPDLLMATDPDGDRIGIAVCAPGTQWWEPDLLTGNEVGLLLLDFLCANKELPEDPIVIKTIVTSNMVREICGRYGLEMREVLTGFKYIGEIIGQLERDGQEDRYFFGFEESYGYLSGSYVRDKDAVNGAMLICQMAAHYKARGMTLTDRLKELYDRYGYYVDDIAEFAFEGSAGMAAMAAVLGSLRRDPPEAFAGSPVESFIDYMNHDTGLPRSEVLRYTMANGAGLIARPSGTEPKLKVYLSAKEKSKEASLAATQKMKDEISDYIGKNDA
ncbi:MAG TPA: phospho-sugar mutase, partial [Anaerovoracaceae bacterium]|nr:phospho-sugar mutase [Anaerovoracaceae bacterium]